MSGLALGGYGIGPLMFNTIAGAVLNPKNQPYDKDTGRFPEDVNENWQKGWLVIISTYVGLTILSLILIFPGPITQHKAEGADKNNRRSQLSSGSFSTNQDDVLNLKDS